MTQNTINRYQPGGDIYGQLLTQYGQSGADTIAQAALSGDASQVTAAIAKVKYGQPLQTSTLAIFGNQLATDPLAAPLQSANNVLTNSFTAFLKSPAVVLTVAVILFFAFGGSTWIRNKVTR